MFVVGGRLLTLGDVALDSALCDAPGGASRMISFESVNARGKLKTGLSSQTSQRNSISLIMSPHR
jgi:hypothetical protein